MQEFRKYSREDLQEKPLCSFTSLCSINGKPLTQNNTKTCILNISAGGLCFRSHIHFPLQKNLRLLFKIRLMNIPFELPGKIVWHKPLSNHMHEYGVEFEVEENNRTLLSKLINDTMVWYKKTRFAPDCSFCNEVCSFRDIAPEVEHI
ncbi:PilZ domain-containing protein [Bacillus tianshenii]|nr:PilZ domain-containing protein [Bacillus tianshenii]